MTCTEFDDKLRNLAQINTPADTLWLIQQLAEMHHQIHALEHQLAHLKSISSKGNSNAKMVQSAAMQ